MYGTLIVKTFKEFAEFVKTYKGNHTNIGYDVETNAKDLHSKDHKVIGFSIAFDKEIGIYVPLKALDFQVTSSDERLIKKSLTEMFKKNEVTVYNCMHEYPATLNWLNLELPKLHDVFVMVKLMMGNAEKYEGDGGLKIQAAVHLGFENWSEDLQEYFSYLRKRSESQTELETFLKAYYDDSEIPNLMDLINAIPEEELSEKVISYEYVPYKVIGRYGSLDSTVLLHLYEFYKDWMKKESDTLGIDLNTGYDSWLKHHYAGYTLERNGAFWNDEKAQEIEDWCSEGMTTSLKNLVLSPMSKDWCRQKLEDSVNLQFMLDYTNLITPEYIPISITKTYVTVSCVTDKAERALQLMSLQPKKIKKDSGIKKYTLKPGNFLTIIRTKISNGDLNGDEINSILDRIYEDKFTEILNSNDPKIISKKLLNPNATVSEFKSYVSQIVLTDNVRFAKLYFDILKLMEDQNFDIDYYKDFKNERTGLIDNEVKYPKIKNPKYQKYAPKFKIKEFKKEHPEYSYIPTEDSNFLEFVDKLSKSESKQKFRLFCKQISKSNLSMLSSTINSVAAYTLDSLDDDTMIELYSYFEFSGTNIDDKSTWDESFNWLYNFRWFKKYSKLISTYINGSVGRKSVWYVPKAEFESGEWYTKRSFPYFSDEGKKLRDNPEELSKFDTVLQTRFLVDMADSGRWKATMHTMPAGNTIKGIVQSRYKGGVIAMPDCSQAEVRVLARAANDENLLNAFRNGLDIHRFVASLTNHVPIEDVTPVQRKVAKSAVFGILYGETEQSFADEHFGGDIKQAHEVFMYVYKSFPGIKGYVDKCHNDYDKYGKVTLPITGRYMDLTKLEVSDDKDKIYRQSQNFPIQGCLSGDTLIKTLDGESKPIKDLVGNEVVYVYAYDSERKKIVPTIGLNPHKTKEVSELYQITFDNNQTIKVTEEHPIMLRDGSFKEASKLHIGDSVMSMYRKHPKKVISVEKITLNTRVPVYDLTVPKYQNFVVDLGDNSGVVVHNCTADVAGLILYKICEYIKDNSLKSKPFCFIHDSIEIDLHPDETFRMLDKLRPLFNEYPDKEFGIPMASDMVFSCNMGSEIEIEDMVYDEEYNDVTITLNGFQNEIDDVLTSWRSVYDLVEKVETYEETSKDVYVPLGGLFMKKVVISKEMGSTKKKVSQRYHIVRNLAQNTV